MTAMRILGDRPAPHRMRPLRETERAILEAIRRQPGQSRAQLAAGLRLSPALMSGTIATFLDEGWITEERQRRPTGRGQPALHLRLRPGAIGGLGVSLSSGGIQVAAMDLTGMAIGTIIEPIGAQDFDAALPALLAAVEELLHGAGCWAGITIWIPALLNTAGEIEEVTPSQRGVDFLRYKAELEHRFGLPVGLESKCPAIDEAMFGSRPDALLFVLFLDYGIGGSMVDGLRVFRGGFGQAVNIGALIPDSGPRPSLPDLARHLGLSGTEPGPDVFAAMEAAPNIRLDEWIASRGAALSGPLSIVVQLLNPTEIVLSGMFPEKVLDGLAAQIELDLYDAPGRVPIGKPQLRRAGRVGPGSLAVCAGSTSLYRAISRPGA